MRHILPAFIFLFISVAAISQAGKTADVILKTNGDELKGEVQAIEDSAVKFVYSGEKLVYSIRKAEIIKITFASGRVEFYNRGVSQPAANSTPVAAPAQPQSTAEDRRNKVAILPFKFIEDGQNAAQEVSEEVQNECYDMLSKHAGVYTVISPRATNVKLNKAGITRETIMNYTMEEISTILGVEYIVSGMVTMNKTTQSNYGSGSYSSSTKDNTKTDGQKSSGYGSTYSTSTQNYQTVMDFKIFNDKSEIVYNQNRKAFWPQRDAYKATLEYLLKRCPLYTK
ncbi:hypothetical protein [Deminuibacter soli]|uniref:Uncharacterized protein n=1 Tax=Deminuibacter soli TaxID=2291815 RepID=A0A3E1NG09_9BACT|nr:hypothetical protein [Deminuibacter soli]RFM26906.1 hypothetical protein DXN05_18140 [Deminuibacter soli]